MEILFCDSPLGRFVRAKKVSDLERYASRINAERRRSAAGETNDSAD